MERMQRQLYNLMRVIVITLVAMLLWDLYLTVSGAKSEFNYVVNRIDSGLIATQARTLLDQP